MVKYRSDIDGLRAIAVGGVVLFHALPWALTGGFVGVDVFFVLSGFLITSIISGEAERGEFSITRFYERRFRRIMPALVLMTVVTSIASVFIISPIGLEDLGRSLIGVATFTANVVFWADTGYFAPDAADMPLLHTWSLAVEEQFYILWPFLTAYLARRQDKRPLRVFVVVTVLASLALSTVGVKYYRDLTFYMLPTRAWELGLGAMVAVGAIPKFRSAVQREAAAVIGVLLILVPMAFYTEGVPFPGPAALPPCLGAVLIIHAGSDFKTRIGRLLSVGPLLYVGLISYSFYLWHWPVLVLPRLALNRQLTIAESLVAIAFAFLLAAMSTKYVESRFRSGKGWKISRAQVLSASVGTATVIAAVGLVFVQTKGFLHYTNADVQIAMRAYDDINPRRRFCHSGQAGLGANLGALSHCVSGKPDGKPGYDLLLWGDSHADHLMPGIEDVASRSGLEVRQATISGCSPLSAYIAYAPKNPGCARMYDTALKEASAQSDLDAIIVSSSWASTLPAIYETVGHHDEAKTAEVFTDGLRAVLAEIRIKVPHKQIVLVGTTPMYDLALPRCFAREAKLGTAETCAERVPTDVRWGPIADLLISRLADKGVTVVLPRHAFCHGALCETRANGKILYYDDDHLSVAGSRMVGPMVMGVLGRHT